MSRPWLATATLVVALTLSACGGEDPAESQRSPEKASAGSSTLLGPGSDIADEPEARGDIEVIQCRPTKDRKSWKVRVALVNSSEEAARYSFALRVARRGDGSVVGRAESDSDVIAAGRRERLTVPVKAEEKAGKVNCLVVAASRQPA